MNLAETGLLAYAAYGFSTAVYHYEKNLSQHSKKQSNVRQRQVESSCRSDLLLVGRFSASRRYLYRLNRFWWMAAHVAETHVSLLCYWSIREARRLLIEMAKLRVSKLYSFSTGRLMGYYCFARCACRPSASSVVVCDAAGGRPTLHRGPVRLSPVRTTYCSACMSVSRISSTSC